MAIGATEGRLYLIGGEGPTSVIDTVMAYDIAANRWSRLQPMPHPRFGAAYAQVDNRLFVIGGSANPIFSVSDLNEVYLIPPDDRPLPDEATLAEQAQAAAALEEVGAEGLPSNSPEQSSTAEEGY